MAIVGVLRFILVYIFGRSTAHKQVKACRQGEVYESDTSSRQHSSCERIRVTPTTTMLFQVVLLLILRTSLAFNFFGPTTYRKGDDVLLLLNKIESDHTQLPYRYHDLPFVCHSDQQQPKTLLLGEILKGDRFWESMYKLEFGIDQPCVYLCAMSTSIGSLKRADYLVKNGYVVHWNVDGLPGATTFTGKTRSAKYYAAGFPLGFVEDDIAYLYNHVTLVLRYHTEKNNRHSIVGFEVYPRSIDDDRCLTEYDYYDNFAILPEGPKKSQEKNHLIHYTYSVYWREDNTIDYNSRWDLYYANDILRNGKSVRWISLVNSLMLVTVVSLVAATFVYRLFKSDNVSIKESEHDADDLWKTLAHNAMDPPQNIRILSTLTACGVQSIVAAVGVLLTLFINNSLHFGSSISASAFFNNHQGAIFTCSLIILLASGFASSFLGIIVHKLLVNDPPGLLYRGYTTLVLSFIFSALLPSVTLGGMLVINMIVWAKESSNALPFGTLVLIVILFAVVEIPLGLFGGILGNGISFSPRSFLVTSYVALSAQRSAFGFMPDRRKVLITILFGIIPFGIVYVDLQLILNSIWLEKTTFFYMYGFLLFTTLLLLVVVAESSVLITYFSLTVFKDPQWQWLSFGVSSSIGFYVFLYSIYYHIYHLLIADFVSSLIYFSYMALVSAAIGIGCGAVGVISSLLFVRKIYSTAKRD